MPDKKGYTVEIVINCYDDNGDKISQTDCDWYGFDRTMANTVTMSLIDGVQSVVSNWEALRTGGEKPTPKPPRR